MPIDHWLRELEELKVIQKEIPVDEKELETEYEKTADNLFRRLSIKYLTANSAKYDLSSTYRAIPPSSNTDSLLDDLILRPADTYSIETVYNSIDFSNVSFVEAIDLCSDVDCKSSLSLQRLPDIHSMGNIMGSSENYPFLPGGLDNDYLNEVLDNSGVPTDRNTDRYINFETMDVSQLLVYAPGISTSINQTNLYVGDNAASRIESEEPVDQTIANINTVDLNKIDLFELLDLAYAENSIASDLFIREQEPKTEQMSANCELTNTCSTEDDIDFDIEGLNLPEVENRLEISEKTQKLFEESEKKFSCTEMLNSSENVPEYEAIKHKLARTYPFPLDPFQQNAVVCLERGDSVFVAAHTSAGKTVVAEYAIALCEQHNTRAIYTSPIKALSNQKYRDLKAIFGDIGIVTGDVQLNSSAFAVVMTTEILRLMLFNGSEFIRELEWVIFDEVHYINDCERGHVWEEVLIMLPAHVKIVMLSATVPNCVEFADWVGRIKKQKIFVIFTIRRPVPLEHYLYTGKDGKTKNDLFLIVDRTGQLIHKGYCKATEAKSKIKPISRAFEHSNRHDKNVYINLLAYLNTHDLLPTVVFLFSRRRCDETALILQSIDLTTAKEKNAIHHFFTKSISIIRAVDRKLPQILRLAEHCQRGFAVHHSGILPILKEIVELLFQRGLVKVLFATETFSMGVNMPARTVVFDSLEKTDGKHWRFLNAGEYIQMAGRAGRRGLDTTGTVIVLCKDRSVPELSDLSRIMLGKPMKLESQFRITYNMLLCLLRIEHLKVEDMLQRSYIENPAAQQLSSRKNKLKMLQEKLAALPLLECSFCCGNSEDLYKDSPLMIFYKIIWQFVENRANMWSDLMSASSLSKFMNCGRVVIVSLPFRSPPVTLGVVLKVFHENAKWFMQLLIPTKKGADFLVEEKRKLETFSALSDDEKHRKSLTQLMENAISNGFDSFDWTLENASNSCRRLDRIPIDYVIGISKKTVKVDYNMFAERSNQPSFKDDSFDTLLETIFLQLDRIGLKHLNDVNVSDILLPGSDIPVNELTVLSKVIRVNELRNKISAGNKLSCQNCFSLRKHFLMLHETMRVKEEIAQISHALSFDGLFLTDEYRNRLAVLRRLNYIDDCNMLTLKGRVACELHHQELVITELILDNTLQNLSAPEIASILSVTTCQSKSGPLKLPDPNYERPGVLIELEKSIVSVAKRIAEVQRECNLLAADPMEEISFDLMHVVYEWANATSFARIMEITNIQEGIIVRCIQRLQEICKDVRNAARLVGEPHLYETMEVVSASIKRDIVFAASLYTRNE